MLRRIILENFMSHGRTEIDLADGLTVLTGPNNCGKSAVVAALQILATNGRSKHVLRHGTKFCRVTVETDDGHTIGWERNKTTVKYTIDGEDIHRVGTSVPDSLHDLLRLDRVETEAGKTRHEYDIHFGEQKSPIFLLGETGSRAASFFASSSDASRLVEMQHLHRLKLREQRAEAKRLNAENENNSKKLKSFEPIEAISIQVAQADSLLKKNITSNQCLEKLKKLIGQLETQRLKCGHYQKLHYTLERLDQAAITPTDLQQVELAVERLRHLTLNISEHERRLAQSKVLSNALKTLTPVPKVHEVARLRSIIDSKKSEIVRRSSAYAILNICSKLKPSPVLEPSAACELVLDRIVAATKKQNSAETNCRLLSRLVSVPVLDSTNRLSTLIIELNNQRSTANSFQRRAECLARLKPTVAETDVSTMTTAIGQLKNSLANVEQTRKDTDAAKQQVAECELEIRQFVKANPKCETCGASLDPEALMTSVPSVHDHSSIAGADSDSAEKGTPS